MADSAELALDTRSPCREKLPPLTDISLADLSSARGSFSGAAVDYGSPCTAAEDRTCHIVPHISAWNEFLFHVRLELREVAGTRSGQLCLTSVECHEYPDAGEEQLHQSATLLFWLLSTHSCVTCVSVSFWRLKTYRGLLADALAHSAVKTVKLQLPRCLVSLDISKILSSVGQLEELELTTGGQCSFEVLSALSMLLEVKASLTVLKVPDVTMERSYADRFLTALKRTTTLKELSLHESILSEASLPRRASFAEFLANSTTLTTLSVGTDCELWHLYSFVPTSLSLKWILKGLLVNRVVSSVVLRNMTVDDESAELLQAVFAENRVLRKFSLTSQKGNSQFRPTLLFGSWIAALAQNDTLEELTLPFHIWRPDSWKAFLGTLSTRKNLRMVTVGVDISDYVELLPICRHLGASGADEKVSFGTYYVEKNFELLEWKVFSEVCVLCFGNFKSSVLHLLHKLPLFSHVTCARLDIWAGDRPLSLAVAKCLEAVSTLQKLHLWLGSADGSSDDTDGWQSVILESLSRNTSVTELYVTAMHMEQQDLQLLANAVKNSRKIQKVQFGTVSLNESSVLIRLLSVGITDNYTLLSVTLDGPVAHDAVGQLFTVCDTARRNSGLVARAALFVRGARQESCFARALEHVSDHPVLLEELCERESLSASAAAAMIRSRLKTIEGMNEFMRLAGVVKERVTCHTSPEGRTQLMNLDEYCWRHVRQYLKIDDVLNSGSPSSHFHVRLN
ncbi:uncharacterized protein LOC144123613 [Amblyomma americanum]